MKKKFEANVAAEIPKTKSQEPGLPWKLNTEDLEGAKSQEEEFKAATTGMPPLKTRAIFLIMLVLSIFAFMVYAVSNMVVENENMRTTMLRNEKEAYSMQASLEKIANEKKALDENAAQLERRLNDLSAQKELFTAVIESLTKKGEETDVVNKEEPKKEE